MAARFERLVPSLCLTLLVPPGCAPTRIQLGGWDDDGGGGGTGGTTAGPSPGSLDGSETGGGDGSLGSSTGSVDGCGAPYLAFDVDQAGGWQRSSVASSGPLGPVTAPSRDGSAIECAVESGTSHDARCYRELTSTLELGAVVQRFQLWYDPPTTFADEGAPSVVPAIEVGLDHYGEGAHRRLALQWHNAGAAIAGWRYWDPAAGAWRPTGVAQELEPESWHWLELRGRLTETGVAYERFTVDGQVHSLGGVELGHASAEPGLEGTTVMVQADANASGDPWRLVVDAVDVQACSDLECDDPLTWFPDLDMDGHGDVRGAITACTAPSGYVEASDDCDDDDPLMRPGVAPRGGLDFDPPLVGQILGDVEPTSWDVYVDGHGSMANLSAGGGCAGMDLDYSLVAGPEDDWVVARRELPPTDLGGADFLLVPFAGEEVAPRTLEIKLQDGDGCMTMQSLELVTDLPVCRTAVLRMEGFTVPGAASCGGTTDPSNITAIEIGISEAGAAMTDSGVLGTVSLGPIRFATDAELRRPMTSFECSGPRGDVMARIARRLLLEQRPHGLVPSWYDETPNYNTYTQAMALVVLSLEHARSGNPAYRAGAEALAQRLLAMQGQTVGLGAWSDLYEDDGHGGLQGLPSASVSTVARTVIGLRIFLAHASPADPSPHELAIADAAAWIEAQPDLSSRGTVDLISAYFAMLAAGSPRAASDIAMELMTSRWDAADRYFPMSADGPYLAIDVMCGWGSELLRREGLELEALESCGLAAGIFPVRSFDDAVAGLGDIAGPWQPSVELTGSYAHAGGLGAETVLEQMLALEDPASPGAFPGAVADFEGGPGWNTSMHGISPSSWVYLALHGPGWLRAL